MGFVLLLLLFLTFEEEAICFAFPGVFLTLLVEPILEFFIGETFLYVLDFP